MPNALNYYPSTVDHCSGSIAASILVYILLLVEHSDVLTIVENQASIGHSTLSTAKSGVNSASEESVIALLRAKCLPILLYATEVCPLVSHDINSLEFTTTRVLMKIFGTGSTATMLNVSAI